MMRMAFVSRSRQIGASLAERRRAWVLVLNTSVVVGSAAAEGEFPAKDQATTFAGLVVSSDRTAFPLEFASAQSAVKAWRELARGFVTAARPELKALLADGMVGAARLVLRIIEIEDQGMAAQTARRLGERED